jgi:hypothetical protein
MKLFPLILLFILLQKPAEVQSMAATICGISSAEVDGAIHWYAYWFGLPNPKSYVANTAVGGMCMVGNELTVVALPSVSLAFAFQHEGSERRWAYVTGREVSGHKDLSSYFAWMENELSREPVRAKGAGSYAPQSVPPVEYIDRNGRVVREGGTSAVQPRQNTSYEGFKHVLPALLPPVSQTAKTFDAPLASDIVERVRRQWLAFAACPCTVSLPFFSQHDNVIHVLAEEQRGGLLIFAVRQSAGREIVISSPFYNRYDPAHRTLVRRLRQQTAQVYVVEASRQKDR